MDGKLFHAPIGETPQRVLDIATGTGIWAMDFGEPFFRKLEELAHISPQPTIILPLRYRRFHAGNLPSR